jgi:hypothetical protein
MILDRLSRWEPAAVVASAALPITAAALPETNAVISHLRDELSDESYESLARKGEGMTTAAIVTYAYDQIDQTRTALADVST